MIKDMNEFFKSPPETIPEEILKELADNKIDIKNAYKTVVVDSRMCTIFDKDLIHVHILLLPPPDSSNDDDNNKRIKSDSFNATSCVIMMYAKFDKDNNIISCKETKTKEIFFSC